MNENLNTVPVQEQDPSQPETVKAPSEFDPYTATPSPIAEQVQEPAVGQPEQIEILSDPSQAATEDIQLNESEQAESKTQENEDSDESEEQNQHHNNAEHDPMKQTPTLIAKGEAREEDISPEIEAKTSDDENSEGNFQSEEINAEATNVVEEQQEQKEEKPEEESSGFFGGWFGGSTPEADKAEEPVEQEEEQKETVEPEEEQQEPVHDAAADIFSSGYDIPDTAEIKFHEPTGGQGRDECAHFGVFFFSFNRSLPGVTIHIALFTFSTPKITSIYQM